MRPRSLRRRRAAIGGPDTSKHLTGGIGDENKVRGNQTSWAAALLSVAVAAGTGAAMAQEPPPPSPPSLGQTATGYTVTGRVLCGDTQRPARFTEVDLLPATQGEGGDDFGGRGRRLAAHTDLDGNFTVSSVPSGDYYVTGALAGYVNATSAVQAALRAGTDPEAAAPGVPLVHVSAGGASTALTLQRGGVIAGTVQWDDGSPAAGVQVLAQVAPATGASALVATPSTFGGGARPGNPGGFGSAQTDDRGRYRLTGLPPAGYLVRAAVQVPVPVRGDTRAFTRTFNLYVYAPDKMRRTDAVPVMVAGTEEHSDVAITMALAGLHSISGAVSSPGSAVRSGTVNLTDQADSTLNRVGLIAADSSFLVPDVPPGNYSLTVNASTQAASNGGRGGTSGSGVRLQPLQESVTVTDGDLAGLAITVAPAAGMQ